MGRLLIYLLILIWLLLATIVKWISKGANSKNSHVRNVVRSLLIIFLSGCVLYGIYFYANKDKLAYDKLMEYPTIENCQIFIRKYPKSTKKFEAKEWIENKYRKELAAASDSAGLAKFIKKYSHNYRYEEEYKQPFLDQAINLLNIEKQRLEKERLARTIQENKWKTEQNAWKTATSMNTLAAYQLYLSLYPNGRHHTQAQQMAIDLEVTNVFAEGNYAPLPSMNRTSYVESSYSSVYVQNDTRYNLTLLYSGIESKRVTIPPRQVKNIRLKPGTYRIVASVDASNVRNFAGEENLTGGSYSVSYYIQTSRH